MFILFIAACFVFQSYAESLADEKKTVTPQEFVTAVSEVPNKVSNFVKNEVEKTKEYQKNSWANGKEQLANTKQSILNLFYKVKENVTQD